MLGHGAYLGPDYTAEALHKMTEAMHVGRRASYATLGLGDKAKIDAEVAAELKENRYDSISGLLPFTGAQTAGWNSVVDYYRRTFGEGNPDASLPRGALLPDSEGGQDPVKSLQASKELAAFVT